ncbi:class I adenylate cyclase, partial [uncultured Tolumonas sp.]|uniref:class I adenylate cyclase n=1 Tax=uncultured Tolumonas sp. TaxID=263765 RepID=UPI002A0A8EFF
MVCWWRTTQVALRQMGSDITHSSLQQFCQDLADTFPVELPPAGNLALSRPCEIRHLGIFINLERDPTADWPEEMPPVLAHGEDMLCFGQRQECLVGTIDLVYRNSWNEVRTLHFNGLDAVVEALSH